MPLKLHVVCCHSHLLSTLAECSMCNAGMSAIPTPRHKHLHVDCQS